MKNQTALLGLCGGGLSHQLQAHKNLLLRFNPKLSLHSRSKGFSLEELFEESLQAARALKPVFEPSLPVIDIGSGNGIPALPLAAMFPQTAFTLCERGAEKAEFLRYAVFKMKLKNVQILCHDGSLLKGAFRKSFPLAVSKGVSAREVLRALEAALAPSGRAFLWKSAGWLADWPETDRFSAKPFTSCAVRGKTRIFIEVRRQRV